MDNRELIGTLIALACIVFAIAAGNSCHQKSPNYVPPAAISPEQMAEKWLGPEGGRVRSCGRVLMNSATCDVVTTAGVEVRLECYPINNSCLRVLDRIRR